MSKNNLKKEVLLILTEYNHKMQLSLILFLISFSLLIVYLIMIAGLKMELLIPQIVTLFLLTALSVISGTMYFDYKHQTKKILELIR